jgi:hypothetical protein
MVMQPDTADSATVSDDEQVQNPAPAGRFRYPSRHLCGLDPRPRRAAHGCGSGQQEVSQGDDALGLIAGFLVAGATSVVGSLWPLNSADAATFSEAFYLTAFEAATTDDTTGPAVYSEPGDK